MWQRASTSSTAAKPTMAKRPFTRWRRYPAKGRQIDVVALVAGMEPALATDSWEVASVLLRSCCRIRMTKVIAGGGEQLPAPLTIKSQNTVVICLQRWSMADADHREIPCLQKLETIFRGHIQGAGRPSSTTNRGALREGAQRPVAAALRATGFLASPVSRPGRDNASATRSD